MKHISKYKTYIALTVALVAMVFVFYALTDRTVRVSISDQGFKPDILTIGPGTVVIFENQGKQLHWPASNSHPTHTQYPETGGCIGSLLDSCRGLERGDTYKFQFNAEGSWAMHDHLWPGLTMIIEVDNRSKPSRIFGSVFSKIKSLTKIGQPLEFPDQKAFLALSEIEQLKRIKEWAKADPVATWTYVRDLSVVDSQLFIRMHELGHIVGNSLYEHYGLEGVTHCTFESLFESLYGCFHGVIEQELALQGTGAIEEIQRRCIEIFPPSQARGLSGCLHGLGHGLFMIEGFDLKKALADCDTLIKKSYSDICYDGAFMENVQAIAGDSFDPENPWAFCFSIDSKYYSNCSRYMAVYVLSDRTFDLAVEVCRKADNQVMKETCFETAGFRVAQEYIGDFSAIKDTCSSLGDRLAVRNCLIGAAIVTVYEKYDLWQEISPKLCQALNNAAETEACLGRVERTKRGPV